MSIDYRLKRAEGYCQNIKTKPNINMELVRAEAYELIAQEYNLSVKKLKKILNESVEKQKRISNYEDSYKEDPVKFAKDTITISKAILAHSKAESKELKLNNSTYEHRSTAKKNRADRENRHAGD
jgi:hypothetical protein